MRRWVLVWIALVGLLFSGCVSHKSIDLFAYAEIEYEGYEGEGRARVAVDWEALADAIALQRSAEADPLDADALQYYITFTLNQVQGLRNGDRITAYAAWNKDAAKRWGVTFGGDRKMDTVSGLREAQVVDLFADVIVEYGGIAPHGSAMVRNNATDEFLRTVTYSVDRASELMNGDRLFITARYSESMAEDRGYTIEETKREYKVEGLDEYAHLAKQPDDAAMARISKQTQDVAEVYANDSYTYKQITDDLWAYMNDPKYEPLSVTPHRRYFVTLKTGIRADYGDSENAVITIYELTYRTKKTQGDHETAYFSTIARNIIARQDGSFDFELGECKTYASAKASFDEIYRSSIVSNKTKYDIVELD